MNIGRYYGIAAGTQNAGLYAGGFFNRCETEEYNGATWSNSNNMINCRYMGQGAGQQYAAFFQGGAQGVMPNALENCTEEYNGTNWSAGGATSTRFSLAAAAGTSNSGIVFGGYPALSCTEEYNGSSWSSGGSLICGRSELTGTGTQNGTLAFNGGLSPQRLSCTEEYNGISWTTGGTMLSGRSRSAGAGSQNAAIQSHGFPSTSTVQIYNGNFWRSGESANLSCFNRQGFGNSTNYVVAGTNSSPQTQTEEYNG